ncbi:hypothetical protein ACT009_14725 [Sphingomonas sp. Tas61C01]|uniref:hypothetical protein n=1 Tax=Sphingomonas sp. Tas61C01 TaxID=3458297 RepID=UPI00403EEB7E
MRMVGPRLFEQDELEQVLHNQFSELACDAVHELCAGSGRVSKLMLRRAIIQAARFTNGVRLGAPMPIASRKGRGIDLFEASCLVPFTGERKVLMLAAPAWPTIRPVYGQVMANAIVLEAEVREAFLPWLPSLFAAEIEVIDRHLLAQVDVVRRYHIDLELRARRLVDQIHPDLAAALTMRDSDWTELVNAGAVNQG